MKEDDFIDELFRSNLTHQDIPVDGHALNEAMKMLDARQKKNVRVIYWISGLLGILAIGVGLAFFFCQKDNPVIQQKIETPSPQSPPSNRPQQDVADSVVKSTPSSSETKSDDSTPNVYAEVPKEITADIPRSLTPENNTDTDHNDRRKKKTNSEVGYDRPLNASSKDDNNTNGDKQLGHTNKHTETKVAIGTGDVVEGNIPVSNNTELIIDSAMDSAPIDRVNPEETNKQNNELAQPEIKVDSYTSNQTEITAPENSLTPVSMTAATISSDSTEAVPEIVKPNFEVRSFSKWDLRLAASAFNTYSAVQSRTTYPEAYARQRNQQETSLSGYGLDVSLSRNNERSFMSLGLGYLQTRENIQYEATKTVQNITSEEYWEYESVLYMIVDGTGTNLNTIVWDTSFMEVNVDSTLFVTYDTTTTTTENTAITAFNGTAKWSHLYLPLVYGMRLDHKTKSSLYAVGSLEFDYLTSSTAHYLTSDGQSVMPMTEFPGYRRFMINGSVGIEWRKLLGGDRMYLLVNPGVRTNLYSWNADFKHNTISPYLRAGIGWRLQEK